MQTVMVGLLTRVPPLLVGFLAGSAGLVSAALAGAPLHGAGDARMAADHGAFWAGVVGGLAALLCGLGALAVARQVDRASRLRFSASIAVAGGLGGGLGLTGAVVGSLSSSGGTLSSILARPGMLCWASSPAPLVGALLALALALTAAND